MNWLYYQTGWTGFTIKLDDRAAGLSSSRSNRSKLLYWYLHWLEIRTSKIFGCLLQRTMWSQVMSRWFPGEDSRLDKNKNNRTTGSNRIKENQKESKCRQKCIFGDFHFYAEEIGENSSQAAISWCRSPEELKAHTMSLRRFERYISRVRV